VQVCALCHDVKGGEKSCENLKEERVQMCKEKGGNLVLMVFTVFTSYVAINDKGEDCFKYVPNQCCH